MFEVLTKAGFSIGVYSSIDRAMNAAKAYGDTVTIKGPDMEFVGKFGVDSIKNGVCPDGVDYSWSKRR